MGQEPRVVLRRVAGALVTGVLLVSAVAYPLLATDDEEASGQAAAPSQVDVSSATEAGAEAVADTPGIVMVVSPSLTGDMAVTETLRLPRPTESLLVGPPPVDRAGSQFDDVEVTATEVRLRSPGHVESLPNGPMDEQTRVTVPSTTTADLSYRLSGVTVRSTPSKPGRATAAVTPMLRGLHPDLPVHIVVTGPGVLNLTCPLLAPAEQVCRTGSSLVAQTKAPLPYSKAVVTVQLDLRRP